MKCVLLYFTKDAIFVSAAFTKDAIFVSAAFTKDAIFVSAAFTKDAICENAHQKTQVAQDESASGVTAGCENRTGTSSFAMRKMRRRLKRVRFSFLRISR